MELFAVATITLLAVISPGADFAMVTRNSILYGRRAGLLSALGIAAGVQLHVFYTMIGVGLVIRSSPDIFMGIKILGAIYLVYVGYKTYVSPAASVGSETGAGSLYSGGVSALGALRQGFFTNALNPKTTLFVLSIYTQVVSTGTPALVQFAYGIFMSVAHWAWFSLVALFLSEQRLRTRLLNKQVWVNRVIGVVLASLGLWLSISSVTQA